MRIDLLHNRIVADCITPRFVECFEAELVPMLLSDNPDTDGVLMYEDHLADNLMLGGEWYYPLTVFVGNLTQTKWVKWRVDGNFRGGCPYSYNGADEIGFSVVTELPDGFDNAVLDRAISYPDGSIKLRVVGVKKDPTFLVGRYSQTFVDEMARQISDELVRKLSVERVDNGTLEIQLVFAGETYMEHTSENVTYRRLLLTDKGCQPRDFWIKWTRLDGGQAYTIRDNVSPENVKFELGEDVPQKIREKEYRFLCRSNPDKYQSAMGKRTVTEWRELIKRSIKRGELVKVELPVEKVVDSAVTEPVVPFTESVGFENPIPENSFSESTTVPETAPVPENVPAPEKTPSDNVSGGSTGDDELDRRLKEILGNYATAVSEDVPLVDDSDITRMARAALGVDSPENDEKKAQDDGYVFGIDMPEETVDEEPNDISADNVECVEEEAFDEFDDMPLPVDDVILEVEELPALIEEDTTEESANNEDEIVVPTYENDIEAQRIREEEMRREIEARVRLELEAEAKAKAEAEAERIRLEHERLREENERLRNEARIREEEARKAELERIREEERRLEEERLRREEEERTRARIAEQARIEEAERQRLADIAKTALAEQQRLEEERRIREEKEQEERAAREAARRRMEAERLERERLAKEEEERRRAEPVFVIKHARLIFRRAVDLNVITRIKEIVESTLVSERKAHVHIYMKAYPVDAYTINLDMKLPENEGELLVTLIKAIGNGHLGITKIIVE